MPLLETLGLMAAQGALNTTTGLLTANRNRRWALQDRDYENAYNHPKQQMQRLREAGLNPNLVYGSGAAQNQSATPSQTETEVEPVNVSDSIQAAINSKTAKINNALALQKLREATRENDYWDDNPYEYLRKMKSEVDLIDYNASGKIPNAMQGKIFEQNMYTTKDGFEIFNEPFIQQVNEKIMYDLKNSKSTYEMQEKQRQLYSANIKSIIEAVNQSSDRFKYELAELKYEGKINEAKQKLFEYLQNQVEPILNSLPSWLKNSVIIGSISALAADRLRTRIKKDRYEKEDRQYNRLRNQTQEVTRHPDGTKTIKSKTNWKE